MPERTERHLPLSEQWVVRHHRAGEHLDLPPQPVLSRHRIPGHEALSLEGPHEAMGRRLVQVDAPSELGQAQRHAA